MAEPITREEMLRYFDCGWSGDDYKTPCNITVCSAYKNGNCLRAREAIRSLLLEPDRLQLAPYCPNCEYPIGHQGMKPDRRDAPHQVKKEEEIEDD